MRPSTAFKASGIALLAAAACVSGKLAPIDQVTGLAVLAIQADPPDQLMLIDGGTPTFLWPSAYSAGPTQDGGYFLEPIPRNIDVSALVADPGIDGGIQVVFSTCAQVDATTHQCLGNSPDYQVIGWDDYLPTDAGPAIVATATFTPSEQLLADALALDPEHGFGYLPIPVQVTANAGSEQVVAVKTLTFSQPIVLSTDAGVVIQPADANPLDTQLDLDGAFWPPLQLQSFSGPPHISSGATIKPSLDPQGPPFFVREFDGGLLPFTDYLSFEFYCTAGSFSSPRAGGAPRPGFSFGLGRGDAGTPVYNDAGEEIPSTQVQWNADAGEPSQLVYYWVVVLDGRGGTSFSSFSANYQPP